MEIFAKKGKSLDYQAVVEAFEKVRKPKAVGVTVVGKAVVVSASLLFKASITGQPFLLAEDPERTKENGKNSPFEQLKKVLESGGNVRQVTGLIEEAKIQKGKKPKGRPRATIRVTGYSKPAP